MKNSKGVNNNNDNSNTNIKESEKINKYLNLAKEIKKAVERERDNDISCNWCAWNDPKRLALGTTLKGLRSARILINIPETWGNLMWLRFKCIREKLARSKMITLTIQPNGICTNHYPTREMNTQSSLGFWDTNRSRNPVQETRPSDNFKKKWTCRIVNFATPSDYCVKIKENEKKDNYQDLATELKNAMEHKVDGDTNCNWCI